jgi:peroxiredoxin Q/BCP
MVTVGKRIANFKLPATGAKELSRDDFKGKKLVLYFYPKDNTPGCTREGQDFRDAYPQFEAANTRVVGVSRDSARTHDNFCAKHDFPFDLISDGDETLCKTFDVIRGKTLYGRKYLGIERSTFLIDEQGVLLKEWRGVRVPGHVEQILQAIHA